MVARLKDFFAHRTPWQRRLWNVGTLLGLQEVIEYTDACLSGAASNAMGLTFVVSTAKREVLRDPGAEPMKEELTACLDRLDVETGSKDWRSKIDIAGRHELDQLVRHLRMDYLGNWCTPAGDPAVEFSARALASHLLDIGFSADHLYRWITRVGANFSTLRDLVDAARDMVVSMPPRTYLVSVPCAAPFQKPHEGNHRVVWLEGKQMQYWYGRWFPEDQRRHDSGGFLLTIKGHRDPWSAVEEARITIARVDARAKVSRPGNDTIRPEGLARVVEMIEPLTGVVSPEDGTKMEGNPISYEMSERPRPVKIGSLLRQHSVYRFDDGLPAATDDALELASYMQSQSVGAAIAGGWSAVEALLIRAGEGRHHKAADRLATLISCSLPRAELTPLAFEHMKHANDALADKLRESTNNSKRVRLVEDHLRSGKHLHLIDESDQAAERRIIAIIDQPREQLESIKRYLTESLRRLYNQRNSVMHSGSLRSPTLSATTRTAFSLVAAGLDRIVHAQLAANGQLEPASLVARAEVELRLAGGPAGRSLTSLLD